MDAIRECPNCQASVSETSEFCPQCGEKIQTAPVQITPPSAQPAPPAQPKKLKKRWLALGGGLILLVVCVCLAIGGWFYGDQILEMAGIDLWGNLPGLGGGTVKGEYQPSEGEASIQYAISKDGVVTFSDGERVLTASITADKKANVVWNDMTLDGDGALTAAEQAALKDFSDGELGEALLVLPFNLACKQGADRPTTEQMAALLVPLQMHLKYTTADRWAEVQRLAALSDCPAALAGGEKPIGEEDEPPLFQVSASDPVPFVMGYFPFDEEGAVEGTTEKENSGLLLPKQAWMQAAGWESTANLSSACAPVVSLTGGFLQDMGYLPAPPKPITHTNELGSCNAKCRGACGVDCTTTNCKESKGTRCLTDQAKKNTGMVETMQVFDCGVAQGCVHHDACYDACNDQYGCNSWMATYCMHGSLRSCDEDAAYNYGTANCALWATGRGTFDRREIFQYTDLSVLPRVDYVLCPVQATLNVSPGSVSKGMVLQKYEFKWKLTEIPVTVENIRMKWDFGDAGSKDDPATGEKDFTVDDDNAQGVLTHSYSELDNYEFTIDFYETEFDTLIATKTIPVVIDQMYDLSGYWYIENGNIISDNVTCTQSGEGDDKPDSRLFPIYGTLINSFGSFTRDEKTSTYIWSLDASKLPPDASSADFTFSAEASQSKDGVLFTSHTSFPQPKSSSSLPFAPFNGEMAKNVALAAALPVIPLAWLGRRRKSRALLATSLLLCLLAAGCSGFFFMYGDISSNITFKKVEQINNEQPATVQFGSGAAPQGLYRLSEGVAHYMVDFTIGGGAATIEGETVSSSHCTGTLDVAVTGYVYKDLTISFPKDND